MTIIMVFSPKWSIAQWNIVGLLRRNSKKNEIEFSYTTLVACLMSFWTLHNGDYILSFWIKLMSPFVEFPVSSRNWANGKSLWKSCWKPRKKQQGCTRQCSNDNLIIFLTIKLHLAEEREAICKVSSVTKVRWKRTPMMRSVPTKKSTKNG